jgi:anti-sigma factor RsiW
LNLECEYLDDYLADELSPEAASQFVRHLDACDECRHAMDEQRWIDKLLQSDVGASLESAPAPLVESILAAAVVHDRRRANLVTGSFAAVAAAIVIAVGWTITQSRLLNEVATDGSKAASMGPSALPNEERHAEAQVLNRPKATFVASGDAIAVPVESTHDSVTIVQLFPTTEATRRMEYEFVLQSIRSDSDGD